MLINSKAKIIKTAKNSAIKIVEFLFFWQKNLTILVYICQIAASINYFYNSKGNKLTISGIFCIITPVIIQVLKKQEFIG